MMIDDDKIFFKPGDLVQLKLDVPYKPVMIVSRIERNIIRNKEGHDLLRGVKTRWFTENGLLQEAVWSTKDLILIK